MEAIWDPHRVETLGRIMSRYADHLYTGARLRLGVEGDPCNPFSSADAAPLLTVVEVNRGPGGFVSFRGTIDGEEGRTLDLDNRSIDPKRVWEVSPDGVDDFRQHVNTYRSSGVEVAPSTSENEDFRREFDNFKADTTTAMEDLQKRFKHLSDEYDSVRESFFKGTEGTNVDDERTFRETMATTVRALAGDMLRVSQGQPVEFAHEYADRYDTYIMDRQDKAFRGSLLAKRSDGDMTRRFGSSDESDDGADGNFVAQETCDYPAEDICA